MTRLLAAIAPCLAALCVAMLAGCGSSTGAAATAHPSTSGASVSPAPTFAESEPTFAGPAPTFAPPAAGRPHTAPGPPAAATDETLLAAIASLEVAAETEADTYDRDLFGGAWIDADESGCNTRCEVLAAERTTLADGSSGWLSLYDNYGTGDPGELDIDHMVPLAEAWRSGAWAWDPARRIAFANDLDEPGALIAVTAATNRAKSDKDPARWQPSNDAAWCTYVRDWVATKRKWRLTADTAEVSALRNMATARGC